jgi:hypothetical protein
MGWVEGKKLLLLLDSTPELLKLTNRDKDFHMHPIGLAFDLY